MPVAGYVCKLGGLPLPPWLLLVTHGLGVPHVGGLGLEGTCKTMSAVSFYSVSFYPVYNHTLLYVLQGMAGEDASTSFSSGCCAVKSCFQLTDLLLN